MKITTLVTKDEQEIAVGNLVVLVGPNNTGKSQTLRDIHTRMTSDQNIVSTIIKQVNLDWSEYDSLETLLQKHNIGYTADANNITQYRLNSLTSDLSNAAGSTVNFDWLRSQYSASPEKDFIRQQIGKFLVSFRDASLRLEVAKTSPAYQPHRQSPFTLLQALVVDKSGAEKQLRNAFKEAFEMDILPDTTGFIEFSLRVAKEFAEIPRSIPEAIEVMEQYKLLDNQGDGFKSFAGIVLSLLLSANRVILLDEPEAFLHPTQARILGRWIGQHATDSAAQVIVATHNSFFLEGMLSASEDVDIYRLSRAADKTVYGSITKESTKLLAKEPTLSSQRILESLFYKGVIVCESDTDRAVYQTTSTVVLRNQSLLFIQSYGKKAIPKIVGLLSNCAIPSCAIVDIDILNSEDNDDLGRTLTALDNTRDHRATLEMQKQLTIEVDGKSRSVALDEASKELSELVNELNNGADTWGAIREVLSQVGDNKLKWRPIKRKGLKGFNDGQEPIAAKIINESVKARLFIVPVGELEQWLDLPVSKKNKAAWAEKALEAIHNNQCSEDLASFMRMVLAWMGENVTP